VVGVRYYDEAWPRFVLLNGGGAHRFTYDDKGRLKTSEALSGDPEQAGATPVTGWTETRDYDDAGNAVVVTRMGAAGAIV
jgi:hypothetical protein